MKKQGELMSDLSARLPPSNLLAEQSLLGAILTNNRAYERVGDFLRAEHFADPINGRIYAAIKRRIDAGRMIDALTLKSEFENAGTLDEVGGIEYIAQLLAAMVGIINAREYAQAIYDCWARRELIDIGQDMVNASFAPSEKSAKEIQDAIEVRLSRLTDRAGAAMNRPLVTMNEALDAALQAAKLAADEQGVIGRSTGMPSVDRVIGGMIDGEMTVLAGRPSMGKSAIGFQWAKSIAHQCRDNPKLGGVFVVSLEMKARALGARALSEQSGVAGWRLRFGKHGDYLHQLDVARQQMNDLPLVIEDMSSLNMMHIRSRAREVKRRFGRLALIMIDHLHIVGIAPEDANRNETWQVGKVSNAAKALAKEFDCPMLALAQLSRAVEGRDDKRPTLGDLRQSGNIEQDADAVLFAYRPEYYISTAEPERRSGENDAAYAGRVRSWDEMRASTAGKAELIAAKVREGKTGIVHLRWNAETASFSDDDNQPERRD